jgi:replicative DNA helicase
MVNNDWAHYRGPDEVVSSLQLQKELEETDDGVKIYCGVPFLDELLDAFRLGEIVVISGPPGHGKTSFSRFLLTQFARSGYKSMYFGKEGGINNFFKKFPAPLPEFYMSREYIKSSFDWLEARIIEGQEKFACNIAFVDHLHYILDMAQMEKGNTSVYIGMFMRKLVDMAKRNKVLVFLVAHTNKAVFSMAPNLSDIRDSSFIAQESDMVMFVWRRTEIDKKNGEVEFFGNQCKISVQKNRRNGILKTIKMHYNEGEFIEGEG